VTVAALADSHAAHEFAAIGKFILGTIMPLIGSAMVPNGYQRWGAAIFSLIGIAILIGLLRCGSSPFHAGLATGFVLASMKLATGLRFL
jgi:MFS-type transporter involved in bile tolerance (Atg22 family)